MVHGASHLHLLHLRRPNRKTKCSFDFMNLKENTWQFFYLQVHKHRYNLWLYLWIGDCSLIIGVLVLHGPTRKLQDLWFDPWVTQVLSCMQCAPIPLPSVSQPMFLNSSLPDLPGTRVRLCQHVLIIICHMKNNNLSTGSLHDHLDIFYLFSIFGGVSLIQSLYFIIL